MVRRRRGGGRARAGAALHGQEPHPHAYADPRGEGELLALPCRCLDAASLQVQIWAFCLTRYVADCRTTRPGVVRSVARTSSCSFGFISPSLSLFLSLDTRLFLSALRNAPSPRSWRRLFSHWEKSKRKITRWNEAEATNRG